MSAVDFCSIKSPLKLSSLSRSSFYSLLLLICFCRKINLKMYQYCKRFVRCYNKIKYEPNKTGKRMANDGNKRKIKLIDLN